MWDLSSLTRIGPMHPALEVWSVNHWTTREVLEGLFICPVLSCSPRHSPSLNLAAHNLTPWLRWERHELPWNENRVSWAAGGAGTSSHALLLPYRRNCNWEGLSWNWLYFLGWVDRRVKLILLLSSMCSMFIFFPPVMSWNFSSVLLCSHKDPLLWNPSLGINLKELKAQTQTHYCAPEVIAALFMIAKSWKQLKCPVTHEWITNTWYIHTLAYHSVIKSIEVLTHAAIW